MNRVKGRFVDCARGELLGVMGVECQDLTCTLNWGYMVPNSRYLGPNRR